MWLALSQQFGAKLHHRDVVGVALRRMERELANERRPEVVEDLERELRKT
jgi:hypothetical protein